MQSTCWRILIKEEMTKRGDSWDNVVHVVTLSASKWFEDNLQYDGTDEDEKVRRETSLDPDSELDRKFDNGYGGTEGVPFTVWTRDYVYFPVKYDGAEWVKSVPRNPCAEATEHVGGM